MITDNIKALVTKLEIGEHIGFTFERYIFAYIVMCAFYLTLLKYLTSSSEASGNESCFSLLMMSQRWAGSLFCDRHEGDSVIDSFVCLSWIEEFLNSRAASRASMASSNWSRECSS